MQLPQLTLPPLIHHWPFARPPQVPERMVWTQSTIKLWRQCKRKFYWKIIAGLRPRFRDTALAFGGEAHEALAKWYRSPRARMSTISIKHAAILLEEGRASKDWFDQDEYDKFTSAALTIAGMLNGYAEIYADDRKTWKYKRDHIEMEFAVDCGDFDYCGKVDGFIAVPTKRGRARQLLLEHKTARKIDPGYLERLPVDTQCRGYMFGAVNGLGLKPKGVLYDVIRKCALRKKSGETLEEYTGRIAEDYVARPDFYFYREELPFHKSDMDAFLFEMHQAHLEYLDYATGERGDPLDPRTWPITDGACFDWFKMCPYFRGCTQGVEQGSASALEQPESLHAELDYE